MPDRPRREISRRDMLKIGGLAGAAIQVGAVAGVAVHAGQNHHSYGGWESFEGNTQFFDRKSHLMTGPAYHRVGATRRPSRHTEYIFGRARRLHLALHGEADQPPTWKPEDGLKKLGEPLAGFYDKHPDLLALDLERETKLNPQSKLHRSKYAGYFELANAWSEGWADVFYHYPPKPSSPPSESDYEGIRKEPLTAKSPGHAAQLIKQVAHLYGASLVGIAELNPDWVYDVDVQGAKPGPFEVPPHWKYAIALGVPHEWDQMLSNPAHGTSYDAYARSRIAAARLSVFIKKLGYPARAHMPPSSYDLIIPPILVDAGIGEQGRHGFVITPELGANFRAAVVTTNLPMETDRPIDFGVRDFCNRCKICAEQCPSGSISHAETNQGMETRGYRHWEINQTTCFNFWATAMGPTGCRLCIATCPYSRKNNWVHGMARSMSLHDPTGLADHAMTWMQKSFFDAPGAEAYLPPPDGRFAGYRPAPKWLDIENWFDVKVNNPQNGDHR